MIDKRQASFEAFCLQGISEKMGMKCRRCGVVPGKAMDDDKQRQAQTGISRPTVTIDSWIEAKQGKRTVLFVDAAQLRDGRLF